MKFKYVVITLMFLCLFVSLAGVTASDEIDISNVSATDGESIELEISDTDKLKENFKSIDELNDRIQNSAPEETVKLENDIYVSKDAKIEGIAIYNNITVDGQGHSIDGNMSKMDFLFRIHSDDVILKNIVFSNFHFEHSYNTIEWLSDNGQLINCTFKNNTAVNGAAVDWTGVKEQWPTAVLSTIQQPTAVRFTGMGHMV